MKLCAFADEAGSSLSEQISALKRNGIEYLEIRGVGDKNIADISASEAKEIKKRLDDTGIAVWSIGSPIGKYSLAEDLAPHMERFKRVLESADILGARRIRMFSFYPADKDSGEVTEEKTFAALDKLVTITPKEMILCHENEKDIFGETPDKCIKIHKAFPTLRAVFDPANFVQCGCATPDAFDRLSEYIEYIHIKDAAADGMNVPAGEGLGRIPEIIKRYREIGGEVMTLEPHLALFGGFADLERTESEKKFVYKSQTEAFDSGVRALKNILEVI